MVGAGFHVYAVWDYCITKNRSGFVELNPKYLAFVLDGSREGSEQRVEEAIEYLTRPDPDSRSPEKDGRRLVKEGRFQYRMVNWASYEGIKSIADLREYNRRKQAEYRERKRMKAGKPLRREAETMKKLESGQITQEEADAIASEIKEHPDD